MSIFNVFIKTRLRYEALKMKHRTCARYNPKMLLNDVWSIFFYHLLAGRDGFAFKGTKKPGSIVDRRRAVCTDHCFLETYSYYTTVYLCDRYLAENETNNIMGVV